LAIFFTFVDKGEIRIYMFRFLIAEEVRVRGFVGQCGTAGGKNRHRLTTAA